MNYKAIQDECQRFLDENELGQRELWPEEKDLFERLVGRKKGPQKPIAVMVDRVPDDEEHDALMRSFGFSENDRFGHYSDDEEDYTDRQDFPDHF